jgi:uncharacterized protein YdhG (YjbR/CyaY superfamily)
MQSKALTVDEYIEESPEPRQEALRSIRELIKRKLPSHVEQMRYGMAVYTRRADKEPDVAFASQVQYISIYYAVSVVEAKLPLLAGLNVGKCCVRYSSTQKLDFSVIEEMLNETILQYGP